MYWYRAPLNIVAFVLFVTFDAVGISMELFVPLNIVMLMKLMLVPLKGVVTALGVDLFVPRSRPRARFQFILESVPVRLKALPPSRPMHSGTWQTCLPAPTGVSPQVESNGCSIQDGVLSNTVGFTRVDTIEAPRDIALRW